MSLSNIVYTIKTIGPIFFIIYLGYLLRRKGFITEIFCANASRLVFNVSLPFLIFFKLTKLEFTSLINYKQLMFCYLGTISVVLLVWLCAKFFIEHPGNQGIFIQGSFRGNSAIIGLPLAINLFGDTGLVNATLILISILPLNNFLSVLVLTLPNRKSMQVPFSNIIFNILRNPLIIATITASIFVYFRINLDTTIVRTGTYLGQLAIPLALLALGGSLNLSSIKDNARIASICSFFKTAIVPFILTTIAIIFGFRGMDLATIFIIFATPTAISSYVMAEAMNANKELASAIIIISTTKAVFTLSLGIYILRSFGFLW